MRRFAIVGGLGFNVAVLVATSPPRVEVSDSVPYAVELNPGSPDVWIELEYEFTPDRESGSPYLAASLDLSGDNVGGAGRLELFQLSEPRLDAGVPSEPIGEVAVDAGLGAPIEIDLWLSGGVALKPGRNTTWLLVHLDGDAEVALDGELVLSAEYSETRTSTELRIVEVR